ncbi:Rv3235 family protein [Microbacterium sp. gxy059]|uniref:Rv3235 family protein n=1 Tax=Microbacterium sp. gxy059 TaxID=2957199 RepID=UPI003D992832
MSSATTRLRADDVHEMFAPQRTSASRLPRPEPLIGTLAGGVIEVIAGVRDVDQLARWLGEEPYRALVLRANLAHRARSARGRPARQPSYRVHTLHHQSPADGIVEAVAVVATPARTRAVAMRLEGYDRRWRATSLAVL